MASIQPSATSCNVTYIAHPQKHAHIRVLILAVEAKSYLSFQYLVAGVQQQELEQSHFPYFINRPHLWETYSKMEGCVQSGNRTSCALLTRVMHHLCGSIARVRPDMCRMECSSHRCFFSALEAGSGDGQDVSDICRCGHTFEVGRGLLLKYVAAPSLSCSSHDVHQSVLDKIPKSLVFQGQAVPINGQTLYSHQVVLASTITLVLKP